MLTCAAPLSIYPFGPLTRGAAARKLLSMETTQKQGTLLALLFSLPRQTSSKALADEALARIQGGYELTGTLRKATVQQLAGNAGTTRTNREK